MAAAIPQTEPFIREAIQRNPALLSPRGEAVSLQDQMQSLVYEPFKAVVRRKKSSVYESFKALVWKEQVVRALTQGPFLMVLDGLDECDDKDGVQELIDGMLAFFNKNPLIPLRVFITSRVEEHIQSRLNVPAVRLDNLVDHCSNDDIATFLEILFEDGCRRNSVVQAYVRQHGQWPTQSDRRKLVQHIGGSFIFASAVFKFIMAMHTEANDPPTPMDRLPLALEMNPGLDGLYAQTLARSQHLPCFSDVISTIALLSVPLSTSAIAELLGIHIYEVVNVLVNLQAIIQVPGTDDTPVTLCHTSLRDFLTTQSRSGAFFGHPSHHIRLYLRFLECELKYLRQDPGLFARSGKQIPAVVAYSGGYLHNHLNGGQGCFKPSEYSLAIHLCREALALQPGTSRPIEVLANVFRDRACQIGSLTDLDEAISLHREVLKLRPSPHPVRSFSLNNLGAALLDRHWLAGTMADLEEAISVHREVLELQPWFHPLHSDSLNNLGDVIRNRHQRTGSMADLEEAISLLREALGLRPSPHPGRSLSLTSLGRALVDCHRLTGITADLEEAISLLREAVKLQPSPHPDRPYSLNNLGDALVDRHRRTGTLADLEEAIALHRETLKLRQSPHPNRSYPLGNLGHALMKHHQCTGTLTDLEEAIALHREALELQASPHPDRSYSLDNLSCALLNRYRCTRNVVDLEEAIALHRQALNLQLSPHPDRSATLNNLGNALVDQHECTGTLADLEEAVVLHREALELRALPRPDHSDSLNNLGRALLNRYRCARSMADLQEAIELHREALELRPSPHPDRSDSLNNLGNALVDQHGCTGTLVDLEEAIACHREALKLRALPHPNHSDSLHHLGRALLDRYGCARTMADLDEAISLFHKVLEIRPSSHPDRSDPVGNLVISLLAMYEETSALSHLQEAITHCGELLAFHYPVGHQDRPNHINDLISLLQTRFDATGQEEDLIKITTLREEADRLSASSTVESAT
ncbi:hypothetical protein EST38_g11139 [Candolleomyces aberdarensis]|uniref:Nephrocystin 3-like N-terminal domain-containing protein n=1 Tax=Candolleomyces aberdarensis TaxID=2316362 RepID=A0A4Q2D5L6_9AGAR|nr:hypothetical protein EST38_g11139 [Candolleomyces aberdarensis]